MTTPAMVEPARLLRMGEVAARLAVSRSKVYEMFARGELPGALRIGGSVRVNARQLDSWIESQSAPGPESR